MNGRTSLIIIVALLCLFNACKKSVDSANGASSSALIGKWNLINDSSISTLGPHEIDSNYVGVEGDYFDFRTDGKLYIKEGTNADTLSYQLLADNKIIIQTFGESLNGNYTPSQIVILSSTRATIVAPTPGGEWACRVEVNLARE